MRTLIAVFIALFLVASGAVDSRAQDVTLVMDGARYWSQNCTRCHNARSPLERTDREWVTIVQHMRARGNLTRTEAVAVSAFLMSSNGGADATTNGSVPAASRNDAHRERAPSQPTYDGVGAASQVKAVAPEDLRRIHEFLQAP